jgi:hypothetical protein
MEDTYHGGFYEAYSFSFIFAIFISLYREVQGSFFGMAA